LLACAGLIAAPLQAPGHAQGSSPPPSQAKPVAAAPLSLTRQAVPPATSLCEPSGYVFGFFNGVLTTPRQAEIARLYLQRTYGASTGTGEPIKYEVFYNYSAGFEDFVETFDQRLREQESVLRDRYELFFEALNGGGDRIDQVVNAASGFAAFVASFREYVEAASRTILLTLVATPPTLSNYAEHRTRIDAHIIEGKKLLLFAHSQGNLFANSAYDYSVAKVGQQSVRLVHVAPASPTTRGPHTLADLDLVIAGLRAAGTVPPVTTPIPNPLSRPPGLNGQKDWKGHGLLEIYLNPDLQPAPEIGADVLAALAELTAPPRDAAEGFFTVTLTWNGSGDVDLHTFEPRGAHVYYAARQGSAGFLDVDNVTANGPEHYFASCDEAKLQTGTYGIGLNNYARAAGRVATVQISSSRDGVIATRQMTMGADRGSAGNSAPIRIFNVTVAKNPESGEYSVTAS
jgi:hypothetical protein